MRGIFIEELADYVSLKLIQNTDIANSYILSEITLNVSVQFQYVLTGSYI